MSGKREDVLGWDEYFMSLALLSAGRSKDPNTQVGACVADPHNRIVGIGYNGFPRGCSDDRLPWAREGAYLDTKYPFVCHAEVNTISPLYDAIPPIFVTVSYPIFLSAETARPLLAPLRQ